MQIPAGQDQVWAYYGCFLDIYDAAGNANLGGTHHCIVAEIAYSLAPIPTATATGAAPSPLSWDQLAQRNLQITLSENPQSRATHVAPQAFDIRPSKAADPLARAAGRLSRRTDDRLGQDPSGEHRDHLLARVELEHRPFARQFDLLEPSAQRRRQQHDPVHDHPRRHLHSHPACAERELRRSSDDRPAVNDHPRRSVRHHGAAGRHPARPPAPAAAAAAATAKPAFAIPAAQEHGGGPRAGPDKTR